MPVANPTFYSNVFIFLLVSFSFALLVLFPHDTKTFYVQHLIKLVSHHLSMRSNTMTDIG